MKQILVVWWWITFESYEDYLLYLKNRAPKLTDKKRRRGEYLSKEMEWISNVKNVEMPSRRNAQYVEREIIFNNFLKIVDQKNTILIGLSLWWIFLIKYLSEHFLNEIHSVHLVAPAVTKKLPQETITNGFYSWVDKASKMINYWSKLHFHFSEDDDVIPVSELGIFQSILPKANFYQYNNKNWHFVVADFPEIVELIKSSVK